MNKRILSLTLALMMVLSVFPFQASAAETETPGTFVTEDMPVFVNPLYADQINVDELDLPQVQAPVVESDLLYATYKSEKDAAADLREGLAARQSTITVYVRSSITNTDTLFNKLFEMALEHTGVPNQGDYIKWHFEAGKGKVSYRDYGSYLEATITYNMTYYTTASQENQLTNKVNQLLDQWDLEYVSDYRKVKTVYDYICANITYDHYSSGMFKHTAYAGLMNGTCVCQGYASLMYRFMLELGVDCRVIAGDGGGPHGWNIVKLDGKYYNLDSTWDAGQSYYSYFLKSPANFTDHIRWEDYTTSAFQAAYPMASSNYSAPPVDDVVMISAQGHATGNIVKWGASRNADLYQLYRRVDGDTAWTLVGNTRSLSYKDTSASVGVRYYYKVRGRDGSKMSTLNPAAVSCVRPAGATKLGNVTLTGAIGHSTGNILYWNAVSGAKIYQVYRLESGQSSWTLVTNTGSTGYKDELAKVGVKTYYKVVARNGDIKSDISTSASIYAIRQAPTSLKNVQMESAQGHSTGIIVRWNPVGGANLYQVYRLQSGQSSWKLLTNTGSTGYKDTTAVSGVRYYYKVVARYGDLKSSMNIDSVSAVRP